MVAILITLFVVSLLRHSCGFLADFCFLFWKMNRRVFGGKVTRIVGFIVSADFIDFAIFCLNCPFVGCPFFLCECTSLDFRDTLF